jgi:hypothetical protein
VGAAFLQAVEADAEYTHRWPIDSKTPISDKEGSSARELWDTR